MAEYIDKNKLYEKVFELEKEVRNSLKDSTCINPDSIECVQFRERMIFKHIVFDLPIVEAAPVIHGKWNEYAEKHPFGKKWIECSNCKSINKSMIKFNYCPNCGAKMDLE